MDSDPGRINSSYWFGSPSWDRVFKTPTALAVPVKRGLSWFEPDIYEALSLGRLTFVGVVIWLSPLALRVASFPMTTINHCKVTR